jgi:hypothetical protein
VPRPVPTRVFHMTRVERLASVLEHGLLSDNACRARGIVGIEIGYRHIKERRAARAVPCGAGGTLADYVPWYFAPRSPMLFAITHGMVSEEASDTEQIIYLVSSTQALRGAGLSVVVSNRHAELGYAELTDRDEPLEGDEFVDWPLMEARYWNNNADHPDRKERRQAECLAHPSVPWSVVAEIVVKTERAKREAEAILGRLGVATPIVVRPDWYF